TDRYTKFWDASSFKEIGHLTEGGHCVAFSPDGTRLAIGRSQGCRVTIFDVASRRELMTLRAEGSAVSHCGFAPDGSVLAATYGGAVNLWRAPSWKELGTANR